jgi:hypothetical protein
MFKHFTSIESQKLSYKNKIFTPRGKRTKRIIKKVLILLSSFSYTNIELLSYLFLSFSYHFIFYNLSILFFVSILYTFTSLYIQQLTKYGEKYQFDSIPTASLCSDKVNSRRKNNDLQKHCKILKKTWGLSGSRKLSQKQSFCSSRSLPQSIAFII